MPAFLQSQGNIAKWRKKEGDKVSCIQDISYEVVFLIILLCKDYLKIIAFKFLKIGDGYFGLF